MINLTSTMSTMNTKQFSWACLGDLNTKRINFKHLQETNRIVKLTDRIICNTTIDMLTLAHVITMHNWDIGTVFWGTTLKDINH